MTKSEKTALVYYRIAKLNAEIFFSDIAKLIAIEKQLNKWDTDKCNGDVLEQEDGRHFKRHHFIHGPYNIKEYIPDLAESLLEKGNKLIPDGFALFHQTDPRGASLYLAPSESKDYARDGVCLCAR